MSDHPDPLSPEIEAFLAPERRRPDPPAEMQGHILSLIGVTLGFPGGPGPGGSDPTGGAAGGAAGGGGLAVHGVKHIVTGSFAKTVATLVVGGVIGSGVHEAYDRVSDRRAQHAQVAVVAPPAPAPAPPPAAPPPEELAPEPAAATEVRTESPAARREHVSHAEPRERDRGLGAERALIEQARTALSREKYAAAAAVLERHARDFPQGELEEERESLLVQAQVGVERFDQARKGAARFHRRFPRSIFGAVVDEAIKSIP